MNVNALTAAAFRYAEPAHDLTGFCHETGNGMVWKEKENCLKNHTYKNLSSLITLYPR